MVKKTPYHKKALYFIVVVCLGCLISAVSMQRLPEEMVQHPLYPSQLSSPLPEKQDVTLTETFWVWQENFGVKGEKITPSDPTKFILQLSDGKMTSTTDCNRIGGSYITDDEVLSIGEIFSTKMFCSNDSLEQTYAQSLQQVASYQIDGKTLTLILLKDAGEMKFQAQK